MASCRQRLGAQLRDVRGAKIVAARRCVSSPTDRCCRHLGPAVFARGRVQRLGFGIEACRR